MRQGRAACIRGNRCEPRSLAEAIQCCVQHSELETDVIAARIGVRRGYLNDAANADRNDTKFQAELLIPLMLITKNLLPLQYLCRELGGVFVPLPALEGSAHQEIFQAFTHTVTEMGQSGDAIERALADDVITPSEAARIERQIDETVVAALALKALVAARAGRSVSGDPR